MYPIRTLSRPGVRRRALAVTLVASVSAFLTITPDVLRADTVDELATLREELIQSDRELYDKLRYLFGNVLESSKKDQKLISELYRKIENYNDTIDKLEKDIDHYKKLLSGYDDEYNKLRKQNVKLYGELENLKSQLQTVKSRNSTLREEHNRARKEISDVRTEIAETKERLSQEASARREAEAEAAREAERRRAVQAELDAQTKHVRQIEREVEELKKVRPGDADALREQLDDAGENINRLNVRLRALQDKYDTNILVFSISSAAVGAALGVIGLLALRPRPPKPPHVVSVRTKGFGRVTVRPSEPAKAAHRLTVRRERAPMHIKSNLGHEL